MDITLRDVTPDDAESLAHVLITAGENTFRGLVPDQCLTFTEAESAANWRRFLGGEGVPEEDTFVVAHEGGKIIGYAWGGPNDKDQIYGGELRQIQVLPAYQGRGVGRKLVSYVAEKLASQNIHSMRVEVISVNPNRAFYERLGAKYVSEHPYDWDGVTMPMCVYGWADTQGLRQDEKAI